MGVWCWAKPSRFLSGHLISRQDVRKRRKDSFPVRLTLHFSAEGGSLGLGEDLKLHPREHDYLHQQQPVPA